MQTYIEKLMIAFNLIISINAVIFTFLMIKEISKDIDNDVPDNKREVKRKGEQSFKLILDILPLVLVAILVIVILYNKQTKNIWWVFIPIMALNTLGRTNEMFDSFLVAKRSIEITSNVSFTMKEKVSFLIIGLFFCMINISGFIERGFHTIYSIKNDIVADALMTTMLLILITSYYFLIVAIIMQPFRLIIELLLKRNNDLCRGIKTRFDKLEGSYSEIINREHATIRVIAKYEDKKKSKGLLMVIPITVAYDVTRSLLVLFIGLFIAILRECIIAFRNVKHCLSSFMKWFVSISDRRMTGLAFRIALIISIMSMVIINRYAPYVRSVEASTATIEFVASTILIPLLISWVLDYRKRDNTGDKE